MERKRYIIGMLAALAIAGSAEAQVRAEQVEVKKEVLTVAVGFEVHGAPEDMRSRQKMVLRPYLYEGQDTLWLPAAQLYGKIRYKRERQEAALAGDREWTLGERDAMGKEDTLRYAAVASYERWMKQASLGIAYHYEGCGCECCDGHQVVAEDLPVYVAPVPVTEVTPEEPKRFEVVEAQKRWEFRKRNMQVFFPVGKSVVQPDAYGNRETLDEIMDAIRRVMADGKMELQGVEITGFASPEGGELLNRQLGERRAVALRNYVMHEEPTLTEKDFRLVNGVENWDGYVPFLIDGSMALLALSVLEEAGHQEDLFLWDYLYAMALYRSAVIENRSDDVEYDSSCGDIVGTLRRSRSYASKARALAPERFLPDLDRLDSVTSRALTVARMKDVR